MLLHVACKRPQRRPRFVQPGDLQLTFLLGDQVTSLHDSTSGMALSSWMSCPLHHGLQRYMALHDLMAAFCVPHRLHGQVCRGSLSMPASAVFILTGELKFSAFAQPDVQP